MKKKKQMTIEQLARMVQEGFGHMTAHFATKEDLRDLHKDIMKDMMEGFDRVHADIHDLKTTLGPLVRVIAAQDAEIRNLQSRVMRLERKVGLAR